MYIRLTCSRSRVELGYYRGDLGMTRSEYVLSLYNDVRMLDDMQSAALIIDKFSRHFDEHVQAAVLSRGICTMDGLIELLDTSDHIGDLNSYRAAQTMPITSQPPPRYPGQRNLSYENSFRTGDIRGSTPRPGNINSNSANYGQPPSQYQNNPSGQTQGRNTSGNWRESSQPYRQSDTRNAPQTQRGGGTKTRQGNNSAINQIDVELNESGNAEQLYQEPQVP